MATNYSHPYSTTFIAHRFPGASGQNYTVPAGKTAVIRCITYWQQTGLQAISAYVAVTPPGGGSLAIISQYNAPVAGSAILRNSSVWNGWVMCSAGGTINVSTEASTGNMDVTVSGYLLTN